MAERIRSHMHAHGLQEPLQSASLGRLQHRDYPLVCARPCALQSGEGYGCHTKELIMVISSLVVLLLLDLSAAFDTVDHELLLETVERDVGLGGRCLDWLSGYLSDRVQSVAVGDGRSTSRRLVCGVTQGSVLGPLLFTI